ncbi:MAG: class I SAM-dependent methyltransferase [Candidatus Bathyarchaeota archaeon]|nr:class I SAM-dependent methyltransferase [Candidatus Bathyarchaeota archaeon]
MPPTENFKDSIHQANVVVHRSEAKYYEALHPEVYSKKEQKRITSILTAADKMVLNNGKKALDFGAGTGNLTGKLLTLGYSVTAIDISAEMCAILKVKFKTAIEAGKLQVINSPIEAISFARGEFDLIACYSVLHHLPDYIGTLEKLSGYLKEGGVLYIDHEASPFYWKDEPNPFANLVKLLYFHSIPTFNILYFWVAGIRVPSIDYTLSDYWHKKEHPLDHAAIQKALKAYAFSKRVDYYQTGTWIANPIFYVYKLVCKPEMSYWLAKK